MTDENPWGPMHVISFDGIVERMKRKKVQPDASKNSHRAMEEAWMRESLAEERKQTETLLRIEKMWIDFIEVNTRIFKEDEKNKEMVFKAIERAHPGKTRGEITSMLSDQSAKAMESLTEMLKRIDQEREKNTFQPFRVERRTYPREGQEQEYTAKKDSIDIPLDKIGVVPTYPSFMPDKSKDKSDETEESKKE